jgi:hypothetical protein
LTHPFDVGLLSFKTFSKLSLIQSSIAANSGQSKFRTPFGLIKGKAFDQDRPGHTGQFVKV